MTDSKQADRKQWTTNTVIRQLRGKVQAALGWDILGNSIEAADCSVAELIQDLMEAEFKANLGLAPNQMSLNEVAQPTKGRAAPTTSDSPSTTPDRAGN